MVLSIYGRTGLVSQFWPMGSALNLYKPYTKRIHVKAAEPMLTRMSQTIYKLSLQSLVGYVTNCSVNTIEIFGQTDHLSKVQNNKDYVLRILSSNHNFHNVTSETCLPLMTRILRSLSEWNTMTNRDHLSKLFPMRGTPIIMKGVGMLVVSLRGLNFGFWSHLGCSGQNAITFSREGLV